jgi:hypothetical protein
LHALAATAPPTAARRDEGKNVSCGKSFVKAESSQLRTAPERSLSGHYKQNEHVNSKSIPGDSIRFPFRQTAGMSAAINVPWGAGY